MKFKLSAIDQSPAHNGQPQSQGLHYSTRLAQLCEELGYPRFWIAEPHDTASYSSPCPAIPIAHTAQNTARIRVGRCGVLLSTSSPLQRADAF